MSSARAIPPGRLPGVFNPMHNVSHAVKNGKLVIEIDLSPTAINSAPLSSTGKTHLLATTGGATPVASPNGHAISFALNVMCKKSA